MIKLRCSFPFNKNTVHKKVVFADQCADTRVGDEFTRGVSGGERKRCNVGMEMIIAPGVLFLDEPTTGLDASTANSVIARLKRCHDKQEISTLKFVIHVAVALCIKLISS